MQALQLIGKESLALRELALTSAPAPGHARVRMAFMTLNHLDLYGYRGMAFARRRLPLTVGAEGAGHVVAVGDSGAGDLVGQAVAIYPSVFCGRCPACLQGRENLCQDSPGVMGFHCNGVAVQFVDIPVRMLAPVPPGVPLELAACAPVTFATVHHMLVDNANLQAGESVLVHAAGSGIGSLAIRLARHLGATVLTTVGHEDKVDRARALGAEHVINYRKERFLRVVRELTDRRGVDVVFEHVGADTWEQSLLGLARGGRLVTCGSTTGVEATTNLVHLFNHQIRIHGSFGAPMRGLREALALIGQGVAPVIDSVLSLGDFEHGLRRLRERDVFGKIVLAFPSR
ncbi:NADPH:quinone oxidoreductase [Pseudomonas oryzihabitans]|nr:NADPH:quinone oxidoreductase [Pseudomonas psychrotolerans]